MVKIVTRYSWIIISVVGILIVLALGYRMYAHDVQALTNFSDAYAKFDTAMTAYTTAPAVNETKAQQALADLTTTSMVRISSLIKHDAELMKAERETTDLARKEFLSLSASTYTTELKTQRVAAYAHFRELSQ